MTPQTRAQLDRIGALADALQRERDRIASERARLLAMRAAGCLVGGPLICALDPGELQTRADSTITLIEQIERFVGDVIGRVEAAARRGDDGAAAMVVRTEVAAQRIFGIVRTTSAMSDLVDDAKTMVRETLDDLTDTGMGIGTIVLIGVGVGVAFKLLSSR